MWLVPLRNWILINLNLNSCMWQMTTGLDNTDKTDGRASCRIPVADFPGSPDSELSPQEAWIWSLVREGPHTTQCSQKTNRFQSQVQRPTQASWASGGIWNQTPYFKGSAAWRGPGWHKLSDGQWWETPDLDCKDSNPACTVGKLCLFGQVI